MLGATAVCGMERKGDRCLVIDSSGWLISGCSHIGMEFLISTLYFFSCLYRILLFSELTFIPLIFIPLILFYN